MEYKKVGMKQTMYCNTCQRKTHHELIAVHKRNHETFAMLFEYRYNLWVCLGCDTATLEEAHAGYLPYKGVPEKNSWAESLSKKNATWTSVLYPKRKMYDKQPKHFLNLDEKLAQIYKDVIGSFNNDSRILCAIGLRALLEGICADKGVKVERNLRASIDGLKEYLPLNIVKNLHGFGFMGNKAVHELAPPNTFELHTAIEVIEDLLNFLYELEYKAQSLSSILKKEIKN